MKRTVQFVLLTLLAVTLLYAAQRRFFEQAKISDLQLGLADDSDADIALTFDQGTSTDPRFAWDDSVPSFEFDFDATLGNGNDPTVTTSSFIAPILTARSGSSAGEINFTDGTTVLVKLVYDSTNDTVEMQDGGFELDPCPAVTPATSISAAGCGVLPLGAGATQINTITGCAAGDSGRLLIILCGVATNAFGDGAGNIQPSAAFTCTANDTLSLVCDGTNWLETGRGVN